MGYDKDSTNYRVFDPNMSKVTVTRDVVFNENNSKNQEKEPKHIIFAYDTQDAVDAQTEKKNYVQTTEGNNIDEAENNQEYQGRVLRD